jgi:hypothetical protein
MRMDMIPSWQFLTMENNLKTIRWIVASTEADALTRYRDNGTGWNVLQVVCHLRDFEELFFYRARITMEQQHPDLPFPNPDQLATEKRYDEQQIESVLAEWQSIRANHIAFMKARTGSDWDRTGQHPVRGIMSLIDQLIVTAHHDTTHIEQIMRILMEKK